MWYVNWKDNGICTAPCTLFEDAMDTSCLTDLIWFLTHEVLQRTIVLKNTRIVLSKDNFIEEYSLIPTFNSVIHLMTLFTCVHFRYNTLEFGKFDEILVGI